MFRIVNRKTLKGNVVSDRMNIMSSCHVTFIEQSGKYIFQFFLYLSFCIRNSNNVPVGCLAVSYLSLIHDS